VTHYDTTVSHSTLAEALTDYEVAPKMILLAVWLGYYPPPAKICGERFMFSGLPSGCP